MWRYIKEAFWIRPPIPSLGNVPVNVIAVAGLAILGFANPGFWLLGLGLEAAFLFGMATTRRFQKYVDAGYHRAVKSRAEDMREDLVRQLEPDARRRLSGLEKKVSQVLDVYLRAHEGEHSFRDSTEGLRQLQWSYLKLLIGQQFLNSHQRQVDEQKLTKRIAALEKELEDPEMAQSVRGSKTATLGLLMRRLENISRREQNLRIMESNLTRIEAQVDLALEEAQLDRIPQDASFSIDLAGYLIDGTFFGESAETIAALDEAYGQRDKVTQTD
jgi:hypothetical protein